MTVLIPTTYDKYIWIGNGAPQNLSIRPSDWASSGLYVALDYPEELVDRCIEEGFGATVEYTPNTPERVVIHCPADTIDAIGRVIHADKSLSVEHKDALCELMLRAYKIFRRVEL